jgi:hypothetical protein
VPRGGVTGGFVVESDGLVEEPDELIRGVVPSVTGFCTVVTDGLV